MSAKDETKWLENVFAAIYPQWRAWLQLRHPALAFIHAELVQDAAADLTEYVLKLGDRRLSEDDVRKIGFTILKRRVTDAFRSKAIEWVEHLPLDRLPSNDPKSDPEFSTRYTNLLRLAVGLIAKLDRHDRDLLLRDSSPGRPKRLAMSAGERQRLSRLRARLRDELFKAYGIDVRDYLKG